MSRFPPISDSSRNGQVVVEEEVLKLYDGEPPFKWKDDNGALIGCYAPLSYTPHIIQPWFALARAIYSKEIIQPRPRELVILAVAFAYNNAYVKYCHLHLAARAGLSAEQADLASKGQVPAGLSEIEVVAYETALKLVESRGPLDDASWEKAISVLGKEMLVSVTHVVSSYLYICTLTNIADKVEIPKADDV